VPPTPLLPPVPELELVLVVVLVLAPPAPEVLVAVASEVLLPKAPELLEVAPPLPWPPLPPPLPVEVVAVSFPAHPATVAARKAIIESRRRRGLSAESMAEISLA
jgi:hypothetical protein